MECLTHKTGRQYLAAKDANFLRSALDAALKQIIKPATTLVLEGRASLEARFWKARDVYSFRAFISPRKKSQENAGPLKCRHRSLHVTAAYQGKTQKLTVEAKGGETVTQDIIFTETGLKAVAFDKKAARFYQRRDVGTLERTRRRRAAGNDREEL